MSTSFYVSEHRRVGWKWSPGHDRKDQNEVPNTLERANRCSTSPSPLATISSAQTFTENCGNICNSLTIMLAHKARQVSSPPGGLMVVSVAQDSINHRLHGRKCTVIGMASGNTSCLAVYICKGLNGRFKKEADATTPSTLVLGCSKTVI